jgi:hypothetical protein
VSPRFSLRRLTPALSALVASALAVPVLAAAVATPAAAGATSVYGNDISWPQCSANGAKGLPLPTKSAKFVVVGLTKGLPYTPNPCLASHVKHTRAIGAKLGVYTFAAYPSSSELAQKGGSGPYSKSSRLGRLSNVGYAQGKWSVDTMKKYGVKVPLVWLDVEHRTRSPWSKDKAANRAVVAGAVKAITDAGYKYGYYSYTSAWNDIMGGIASSAPVWATVGNVSRSKAVTMCDRKSFSGGPILISQWYDNTRDHNILCSKATTTAKTTVAASALAAYKNTTLRTGSRGSAVKALQKVVGTPADGIFGKKTRAKVVAYQKRNKLKADGVVNRNDWVKMGAFKTRTVTSTGIAGIFS